MVSRAELFSRAPLFKDDRSIKASGTLVLSRKPTAGVALRSLCGTGPWCVVIIFL